MSGKGQCTKRMAEKSSLGAGSTRSQRAPNLASSRPAWRQDVMRSMSQPAAGHTCKRINNTAMLGTQAACLWMPLQRLHQGQQRLRHVTRGPLPTEVLLVVCDVARGALSAEGVHELQCKQALRQQLLRIRSLPQQAGHQAVPTPCDLCWAGNSLPECCMSAMSAPADT
jgi:hypothetical protein